MPSSIAIAALSLPDALPISNGSRTATRAIFGILTCLIQIVGVTTLVRNCRASPIFRLVVDRGLVLVQGSHRWKRYCCWRQSRARSEEHTSELQSPYDLVCRLPSPSLLFPYPTLFRSPMGHAPRRALFSGS